MKTTWRAELPQLLLIAAMLVASAAVWPQVGERIPMHWNVRGEVDRYGGKWEGLLLLPAFTFALYLMLLFLPRLDPGRANFEHFSSPYLVVRYLLVVVMAIMHGGVLASALGYSVRMEILTPVVVGGMFIILGNFMGKLRPNWLVGVRTPWTLSSKASWDKTHRQAGWLFILSGACLVAAGLIGTLWAAIGAFLVLGLSVVWLILYSYLVWRQDPHRIPPAGTLPEEKEDA